MNKAVSLRIGVNNLFDKGPPIISTDGLLYPAVINNNTYPSTYDSLGRYIFGNATFTF